MGRKRRVGDGERSLVSALALDHYVPSDGSSRAVGIALGKLPPEIEDKLTAIVEKNDGLTLSTLKDSLERETGTKSDNVVQEYGFMTFRHAISSVEGLKVKVDDNGTCIVQKGPVNVQKKPAEPEEEAKGIASIPKTKDDDKKSLMRMAPRIDDPPTDSSQREDPSETVESKKGGNSEVGEKNEEKTEQSETRERPDRADKGKAEGEAEPQLQELLQSALEDVNSFAHSKHQAQSKKAEKGRGKGSGALESEGRWQRVEERPDPDRSLHSGRGDGDHSKGKGDNEKGKGEKGKGKGKVKGEVNNMDTRWQRVDDNQSDLSADNSKYDGEYGKGEYGKGEFGKGKAEKSKKGKGKGKEFEGHNFATVTPAPPPPPPPTAVTLPPPGYADQDANWRQGVQDPSKRHVPHVVAPPGSGGSHSAPPAEAVAPPGKKHWGEVMKEFVRLAHPRTKAMFSREHFKEVMTIVMSEMYERNLELDDLLKGGEECVVTYSDNQPGVPITLPCKGRSTKSGKNTLYLSTLLFQMFADDESYNKMFNRDSTSAMEMTCENQCCINFMHIAGALPHNW